MPWEDKNELREAENARKKEIKRNIGIRRFKDIGEMVTK